MRDARVGDKIKYDVWKGNLKKIWNRVYEEVKDKLVNEVANGVGSVIWDETYERCGRKVRSRLRDPV